MVMRRKAIPTFLLHRGDDLAGQELALFDLLQDEIEFFRDIRPWRDEFDREVSIRRTVRGPVDHEDSKGETRVGLLLRCQSLFKGIHHRFDVARQRAGFFQDCPLVGTECHKLECDRQTAFEGVARAEQALDGVVEIDTAGLQLGADGIIDPVGRAMLDLVPKFQQEGQIVTGAAFNRAFRVFQAVSQFPVSIGALLGSYYSDCRDSGNRFPRAGTRHEANRSRR